MNRPTLEHRRHARVPIDVPVVFRQADSPDTIAGSAKDISLGGMFIETDFPAAFGAVVLIGFTLPGSRPMLVSATVRWTEESGMGVQFGALSARDTYAITQLESEHRVAGWR
jgi:hypothetical protein